MNSLATLMIVWMVTAQPAAQQRTSGLVFENSSKKHFSVSEGVVQIWAGPGWLRTADVYLNFELAFSFRLTDPNTDFGVALRAWPDKKEGWPKQGYWLGFSDGADETVLIGVGSKTAAVLTAPKKNRLPVGTWQQVRVLAQGSRVSVFLNDTPSGVYEIEQLGGYILFQSRSGRVELRRANAEALPIDLPPEILSMETKGLRSPTVLSEVQPEYTSELIRSRAEGEVEVEAVVLTDGSVGAVKVTRSTNAGFDPQALAAVRRWRFRPGTLDGRQVAVRVTVVLEFMLHRKVP